MMKMMMRMRAQKMRPMLMADVAVVSNKLPMVVSVEAVNLADNQRSDRVVATSATLELHSQLITMLQVLLLTAAITARTVLSQRDIMVLQPTVAPLQLAASLTTDTRLPRAPVATGVHNNSSSARHSSLAPSSKSAVARSRVAIDVARRSSSRSSVVASKLLHHHLRTPSMRDAARELKRRRDPQQMTRK